MYPSTQPSDSDFQEMKNNWMNCLPGELSNLFYYQQTNGPIRRYDNYFSLGDDGIAYLQKLDEKDTSTMIRIYMACKEDKFSPVLSIVQGEGTNQTETRFELAYVPSEYKSPTFPPSNKPNPTTQDIVTTGLADLFWVNWVALSESEVSDAFLGVTINQLPNEQDTTPPTSKRVNLYTYGNPDVSRIIAILKNQDPTTCYVRLLLGAGLKAQIIHPFNFRPVLSVGPTPASMQFGNVQADEDPPTYFERSQPCPPYCDPTE